MLMKRKNIKNNEVQKAVINKFEFSEFSGDRSLEILRFIIQKALKMFSDFSEEILAVVPSGHSKTDDHNEYTHEEMVAKLSSAIERQCGTANEPHLKLEIFDKSNPYGL